MGWGAGRSGWEKTGVLDKLPQAEVERRPEVRVHESAACMKRGVLEQKHLQNEVCTF